MSRMRRMMKIIFPVLMVIGALSICWTVTYYVMEWVYRQLDWHPHAVFRQIFNSIAGFMLFGTCIAILSPFFQKKQRAFHQEMIDALKRISKGDFHINLNAKKIEAPMRPLVESINDMALDLKAMEEMRQEFISNVSHEIQSPLTSISGFARAMIYEELIREEQLQYLEIIKTESTRLSKLSNDLLKLASLNSEHHPFHPELYRLDKQLQLQILTFEPQWLNKDLEIVVDLAELVVEADQNLLNQVWVNLISNAVKFTPAGGKISINLERENENAVVRITDTGIGIPAEEQTRIYERFFKADKARSRSAGGSGLGLSIVHKILEMHQGNITVISTLGEGTTFTITFPMIK